MATDSLKLLVSSVLEWLKDLEELGSQIGQRQQDLLQLSEARSQSPAQSTPNENEQAVVVYYDRVIQSSFENLVRLISAQRNSMRKQRMAAKVFHIRHLAVLEMPNDDEIIELEEADRSALYKKQDSPVELKARGLELPSLGRSSRNLDYIIPTRDSQTITRNEKHEAFIKNGEFFDELDKGLEYVQNKCEHAAHELLRKGDCNEEVEVIKDRLIQVKELATNLKGRVFVENSTDEMKFEPEFEPERDTKPGTEHKQTKAIEKVLGRDYHSTVTRQEIRDMKRDSLLEPENEMSADDHARPVVGPTATLKDSIAQDEGLTGKIPLSTSSSEYLSSISGESKVSTWEADVDVATSDPEREETDMGYPRRVERFADPETWSARLERMKSEVIAASFFDHKIAPILAKARNPHARRPPSTTVLNVKPKTATDLAGLLTWEHEDVSEIISGVLANLKTMQGSGYCADSINFLALESNRPDVARLVHVAVDDINSLAGKLQVAFSRKDPFAVMEACFEFLRLLEFTTDRSGVFHVETAFDTNHLGKLAQRNSIGLARFTVLLLDLAILSYSGAHVENLHDYLPSDKGLQLLGLPGFSLRRRTLNCLGAYLKRTVWVFEMSNARGSQNHPTALYLSTRIADFASVWGPVWAVTEPDKPDVIVRYDVGLGSIVDWERGSDEPEPVKGEVFCHWIPASGNHSPGLHMDGGLNGDRMLIGGKLNLNPSCTFDCDKFTVDMENNNRLLPLSVRWRRWYTDSRSISASIGGLGFTVGGSESYKLRHRPYREDLVDALSHGDFDCCLVAIQHRFVVEVSACTGISRRQSLRYALGYSGMRNYMNASDLNWENDEWKDTYFHLIREGDMSELRRRINEDGFGSVMKKALKKSMLNVLLKTGLEAARELFAFWMPSKDDDPQVVSYSLRDYNWIGLLQEGSLGFNTAIVNNICLELPSKSRNRSLTCTHIDKNPNHYSLLETYLLVNDELKSRNELPRGLTLVDCESGKYRERWSVHKIKAGEKFDLGENGLLRVIKVLMPSSRRAESGLIMDWDDLTSSRVRDIYQVARQAIGMMPVPLCHREHLIQRRGAKTAPILIHVVSHPYLVSGRTS